MVTELAGTLVIAAPPTQESPPALEPPLAMNLTALRLPLESEPGTEAVAAGSPASFRLPPHGMLPMRPVVFGVPPAAVL